MLPYEYMDNSEAKFYYYPIEYNQVFLENRVFFFKEQEAIDAGYALRSKPVTLANVLDKAFEGLIFAELLKAPVSALKGVSKRDGELLEQAFGIKTIEDLAENQYFKWAQAIKSLAK